MQLGPIDKSAWSALSLLFKPVSYRKLDYLVKPKQSARYLYFIISGVVRMFFINEDSNKDMNKSFGMELDLVAGDPSSDESWYGIQALEDIEVLQAPMSNFQKLSTKNPSLQSAIGNFYKELAAKKTRREKLFLSQDARGRYNAFLNEYPGLSSRIAQFHIAKYLGITDVALSRLRNN